MTLLRNKSSNTYCGPAALALLTDQHVDAVTYTLRCLRNGRSVRGVYSEQMLEALRLLGHRAVFTPTMSAEHNLYGTYPTLTQALRALKGRGADDRFLVLITGHYIVLKGRKVFDNKHPEGIWLKECPYRRRRVRGVWKVTPR